MLAPTWPPANLEPRWAQDPLIWSQDPRFCQHGFKVSLRCPTWSQDGAKTSKLEPRPCYLVRTSPQDEPKMLQNPNHRWLKMWDRHPWSQDEVKTSNKWYWRAHGQTSKGFPSRNEYCRTLRLQVPRTGLQAQFSARELGASTIDECVKAYMFSF